MPVLSAKTRFRAGFTILEMMAATAVFLIMVTLLLTSLSHINTAWLSSDGQKSRREAARVAIDLIRRDLQSSLAPLPGSATNAVPFEVIKKFGGSANDAIFWGTSLPATMSKSDFQTVGYFVSDNKLYRLSTNAVEPSLKSMTNMAGGGNYQGLLAENVLRFDVATVDRTGVTNDSTTTFQNNLPSAVAITVAITDNRTLLRSPSLVITNMDSPPAGVQVYRTKISIPSAR